MTGWKRMGKIKKIHIRIFILAFLLVFAVSSRLLSQRAFKEAEILSDAETGGLAETGTARQGAPSLLYNPASVALLPSFTLLLNHQEGLFENKTESISFGLPLGRSKFVLSGVFSLNYFMKFTEYTEAGARDMDYFFFLGGVGAGRELFRFNQRQNSVTLGAVLKFIHSRMAEESVTRPLLDTGLQVHFRFGAFGMKREQGNNFTLGLSLLNAGYGYEENSMPLAFRAGFLYRPWPVLALCADFVRDDTERIHAGLEYCFMEFLFFRLGYRFLYDNFSLSAGTGLKYGWKDGNVLKINYAFEPVKELGYGHRIGLEYSRKLMEERESVPLASRLRAEPDLFIPDLAGKKKLKIGMEADADTRSRIVSWQILIYRVFPEKRLFMSIRKKDNRLPALFFWDGKNEKGSIPRPGDELAVVLELTDKNSEKWLSNEERVVAGLELHRQARVLSFTISSSALFEKKSALVRDKAAAVLDQIAQFLKANRKYSLELAVFSDNTGGEKFNLDMCAKQAQSLKVHFVVKGIDQKRIRAAGAGPVRPVSANATEEGREENRRVEFRLVSSG